MIVFVVPLKSREASKDWRLVSALANRCLASLANQSDPEHRVVLVCNEVPEKMQQYPNLSVITCSTPRPANKEQEMHDKWRKVREGLIYARQFAPCFVMVVHADDCISRRLAYFVNRGPRVPGWFVRTGYCHDEGMRWVFRRTEFHRLCGSSSVLFCGNGDFPDPETPKSSCLLLEQGHSRIVDYMEARGTPLQPLPFPAVVYVTGTGENHSGYSLGPLRSRKPYLQKLLPCVPLYPSLRREFNLYSIAR